MARTDTLGNFVTDVAEAIRTKEGTTEKIPVSEFDTRITNLPSGGGTPEIGYTINKWDDTGVPKDIAIVGMTVVPKNYYTSIPRTIEKVIIPEGVVTINDSGLSGMSYLTDVVLPNSLTRINSYALSNNSKLNIKNLNKVEILNLASLQNNTSLVQLSMPYIKTIVTSGISSYAPFRYCSSLKALWIGSSIVSLENYSLSDTSSLIKVFIDLPRATVEKFNGYSNGFKTGGTSDIIICNDDAGWMSQAEFDSIDWANYSG